MIERLESDDGESLEGWIDTLKFGADGLIPAVIQESVTGQVLMVGYMNRQSIEMTLREGRTCFGVGAARGCGPRERLPDISRKCGRSSATATATACS